MLLSAIIIGLLLWRRKRGNSSRSDSGTTAYDDKDDDSVELAGPPADPPRARSGIYGTVNFEPSQTMATSEYGAAPPLAVVYDTAPGAGKSEYGAAPPLAN